MHQWIDLRNPLKFPLFFPTKNHIPIIISPSFLKIHRFFPPEIPSDAATRWLWWLQRPTARRRDPTAPAGRSRTSMDLSRFVAAPKKQMTRPGKHRKNDGKSRFFVGESTINGEKTMENHYFFMGKSTINGDFQ